MERIEDTLSSQYANSSNLYQILDSFNTAVDPKKNIDEFYRLIMNVKTAQGVGLDIWGIIVGVGRAIAMPNPDYDYFGFDGTDKYTPFNDASFYGSDGAQSSYNMPDESYRRVIMIKAYSNILLATAPNINKFLKFAFTRGRSYFLITGHMEAAYVFEYALNDFEKNLIYNYNLLPRPSGVLIKIREVPSSYFGFAGTGFQPFGQTPFYS